MSALHFPAALILPAISAGKLWQRGSPFNDGQFPANERDDLPEDTSILKKRPGFL